VLDEGFREHLGESFAPIHAWSFGGLDRLRGLAEGAGFKVDVLEKPVKPGRFKSVERRTSSSNTKRNTSLSRNRPWRFFEKVE
jgi:hypothetical protein